jgi:hypothetical protein
MMEPVNGPGLAVMSGLGVFMLLLYLAVIVAGIYGFVLFVKLAHRGIKALDIYIKEKSNPNDPHNPQY